VNVSSNTPDGSGTIVRPMPPRVLGHIRGGPGPLVVIVGGLHGNEPDGVQAATALIDLLQGSDIPCAGTVLALSGNRPALERGIRFSGRDLNRTWTHAGIERLGEEGDTHLEDREMRELLMEFDQALDGHGGPAYLIDLHSTSAEGAPFAIMGLRCHAEGLGTGVPLPAVRGLQERLDGALTSWFDEVHGPAMVVEGGKSCTPQTVTNHLDALWLLLAHVGVLDKSLPQIAAAAADLAAHGSELPASFQLAHVHHSAPGEGFTMGRRNGRRYHTFDAIRKGEVLGNDSNGPVVSPVDGWIVMPLYQEGEEGFFIVTEG
tara:strand:- start:631 stop:1584 length:954 start_codon:yes stop_codon:yes gene_type:complete